MIFAYADPPYLGCCGLYDHHHEEPFGCWDDAETHASLVDYLCRHFPEGWAMSASAPSLATILPLCPEGHRTAPWCKTFSVFKKGVRPAYAWEPVIFWRGRNPTAYPHRPPEKGGKQNTPKDFFEEWTPAGLLAPITLKRGLTGAKSEDFCSFVLDLLNVQPGDEVVDLFPGTGVMDRVALARTA
jgi:hypothetical protein